MQPLLQNDIQRTCGAAMSGTTPLTTQASASVRIDNSIYSHSPSQSASTVVVAHSYVSDNVAWSLRK
ncbi:hypothetical protein [Alteromonas australica]|jgi:predicted metalloprotease|uniref:hypothetical protein n=1 Tax=Alteromonas australica TaxID=589873 RepID=UPI002357C723|nr:hypothetical protein [Alteromonas australica]